MLLNDFDENKDAIINPEMCVNKIDNFPEVTISCFSEKLFNNVLLAELDLKILSK